MNVTDPFPSVPPLTSLLHMPRTYGDSFMIKTMNLSLPKMSNNKSFSNFQNIALFSETRRMFGAVAQFQKMDDEALTFLKNIQPTTDPDTLKRIMNWAGISSPKGRPYMLKGEGKKRFVAWGTIVYGGEPIQLVMQNDKPLEKVMHGKYQNCTSKQDITFVKPVMLTRQHISDFNLGKVTVAQLKAQGLIQQCTAAHNQLNPWKPDVFTDHPSGLTMYNPVWSDVDWPCNNGPLWLAKGFLKEFDEDDCNHT